MKFAIFGNTYQATKSVHALNLIKILRDRQADFCIDRDFAKFLALSQGLKMDGIETFVGTDYIADMALSIGGDGTFLRTAERVLDKSVPILGINTGRLGFLADVAPQQLEIVFEEIANHRYSLQERALLQLEFEGETTPLNPYALNEIAVLKHDTSSMISIHTLINEDLLTTYQADGLVIATPTGSTAYSLSVGGPIIMPQTGTIVLTPVAPHSLNVRSIVLRDDARISLKVTSRSHNYLIAVDGRSQSCSEETVIHISKAPKTVKVVKRFNHSEFETLREKMMWGADIR